MPKTRGITMPGRDLYSVDFTEYLPSSLQQDPKMIALANAMAEQLMAASGLIEDVLIYSRIDELPEALVDILAYDMHVDWYDYSYPVEIKRDILKSSVKVHKKMGTKYAIEKALGALYPKSEVEEWFQYDGQPHHFHIVCDVTEDHITASYQDIVNAVKMYKRLSSHMEEVTYQCRIYCTITTSTEFMPYKVPVTGNRKVGTYPQRNTRGGQAGSAFVVGTESAGFIFAATAAGTVPERNTVFRNTATQIDAETALNAFRYTNTPAGQIKSGETPQRSQKGQSVSGAVVLEDNAEGFRYTTPAAGTAPERNTVFRDTVTQIDAETALNAFRYTNTPTGQMKAGETPQRSQKGQSVSGAVVLEDNAKGFRYTTPAAGTAPERSTVQRTGGETAASAVEAAGFLHISKPCGSQRKL